MRKKENLVRKEPVTAAAVFAKIVEYKHWWIRLGVSLVVLGIVYPGVLQYQKFQAANCKKAYRNIDTELKKRAFAHDFEGKPLAGKVALELADKFYAEGQYEEALKHYDMAHSGLLKTCLIGRVYLGKAICCIHFQKIEQAEKVLKRLMEDPKALGALRAEAALQAFLLAIQKKDPEAIQTYKEALERLPYSDIAKERISLIENSSRNP